MSSAGKVDEIAKAITAAEVAVSESKHPIKVMTQQEAKNVGKRAYYIYEYGPESRVLCFSDSRPRVSVSSHIRFEVNESTRRLMGLYNDDVKWVYVQVGWSTSEPGEQEITREDMARLGDRIAAMGRPTDSKSDEQDLPELEDVPDGEAVSSDATERFPVGMPCLGCGTLEKPDPHNTLCRACFLKFMQPGALKLQ